MSIDDLKSIMDEFEPASLLPEVDSLLSAVGTAMRAALLVGPVILLVLGILYILAAPKEANYHFGYRCYFGMGSVEAWRYTQRIAGLVWVVLGLVLTVVMAVIGNGFAGLDTHAVLSRAVTCILWEAGLIAASCILINSMAAYHFTAGGELRRRKAK